MKERLQQLALGERYTLMKGHRILIVPKGALTEFAMLVKGGYALIADKVPNGSAYKLLFKLLDDMQPMSGNMLYVHFETLAEHFGTTTKPIYKLFKLFLDADIIRRVKKGHYVIDPRIVWKGKTADRLLALDAWHQGILPATLTPGSMEAEAVVREHRATKRRGAC